MGGSVTKSKRKLRPLAKDRQIKSDPRQAGMAGKDRQISSSATRRF